VEQASRPAVLNLFSHGFGSLPKQNIHDIPHILLIRDAVGGFLGELNNFPEMVRNVPEKGHPGLRVEFIPPEQGLKGDAGFVRGGALAEPGFEVGILAE
jgi:hypothetical protein